MSTPAQRLARSSLSSSSVQRVTPSEPARQAKKNDEKQDNTNLHDSIKEVTAAIDDYCKTAAPHNHKKHRRQLTSKGTFQGNYKHSYGSLYYSFPPNYCFSANLGSPLSNFSEEGVIFLDFLYYLPKCSIDS